MRNFGQTRDYWLDHCTLTDWNEIYAPELVDSPPLEDLAAMWIGYKPPSHETYAPGQPEEWPCPFPDVTD